MLQQVGSRDSLVSVVTRSRVGPSGIPILAAVRDFSLNQNSRLALGPTQTPVQLVLGHFPGGKAVGT